MANLDPNPHALPRVSDGPTDPATHTPPSNPLSHDFRADADLARGAQAADPQAIDALLRRLECVPRILRSLNGRMGQPLDPHEIDDIVQDTLLLVWKKLSTFNGTSTLDTWAFGLCRFELMNAVRRKRRSGMHLEDLGKEALSIPMEPDEQRPDLDRVDESLRRLRSEDREVIRLRHAEGLSFDLIAKRLKLSTGAVKARYYRALERLAEMLHPDAGERKP